MRDGVRSIVTHARLQRAKREAAQCLKKPVPDKMMGGQNKFSSPHTPFETRDTNVTACPANIYCSHSDTFSITEMLSAYYTDTCSQHSRTNRLSLDKCDLTEITAKSHTTNERMFSSWVVRELAG
jgi:hypothetical protein